MKRVLIVMVVLAMFGCNVIATANVEHTEEKHYDLGIDETYDIVPDIQIYEPGTISVQISWVTPSLTFEQRSRQKDSVIYYALRSPVNVVFSVTNNSRPSSTEGGFSGKITVNANTVEENLTAHENVRVLLAQSGTPITLDKGAINNAYILSYTNRADIDINGYELANIITSDKTADQIKSLMTVQVRFIIAAVK